MTTTSCLQGETDRDFQGDEEVKFLGRKPTVSTVFLAYRSNFHKNEEKKSRRKGHESERRSSPNFMVRPHRRSLRLHPIRLPLGSETETVETRDVSQ